VRRAAATEGTRAVLLDCESMPYIDVTAAEVLFGLRDDLEREGVRLMLARELGQVRDVIARAAAGDEPRPEVFYPSVRAAVAAFEEDDGRRGGARDSP
jgi:MFS superfamily sulfate permease-like transporter